jgi:hypothetical protein
MNEGLKCGKCGAPILATKQNVIFPKAGGVEHLDCTKQGRDQPVIRCALCHTPIRTTVSSRTVEGVAYHAGCWDRKVRSRST